MMTSTRVLPDDTMLVTLTVRELRELLRAEIAGGIRAAIDPMRHRWVDVETAAKHASVTGKTIRRWIVAGLAAVHLGRDYRLRLPDLDAWLEQHLVASQGRPKTTSRA